MICDLGVMLNNPLSYTDHIAFTLSKATRALGFIIRNGSNFRNIKVLEILYFALDLPVIEFGSVF